MKVVELRPLTVLNNAPAVKPEAFSIVGDIISFHKCPRQYGMQKHYGFQPDRPSQRFVGELSHNFLARCWAWYHGRLPGSRLHRLPDDHLDVFLKNETAALKGHGLFAASPGVAESLATSLKAFYAAEMRTLIPRIEKSIVHLDADVNAEVSLTGRVDVLKDDPADRHRFEVIKYKASSYPGHPNTGLLRRMEIKHELNLYAWLAQRALGRMPDRCRAYFILEYADSSVPEHGSMSIVPTKADMDAAVTFALAQAASIRACRGQEEWNPPTAGKRHAGEETCDICEYRGSCSALRLPT